MADDSQFVAKIEKNTSENIKSPIEKALEENAEVLATPEKEKIPDAAQALERLEVTKEKEGAARREKASIISGAQTTQVQREMENKIEKILENGVADFYIKMSPGKQKEFKEAGERTAKEINILLSKAKINVKKIINLIRKWLSLIPGVNKFFLEQETKIKTDEILRLREKN